MPYYVSRLCSYRFSPVKFLHGNFRDWYFEDPITLVGVLGLDKSGVFDFMLALGLHKVVGMLIFEVQVEGRIAQVLFGAEAFIAS